ncbi:unnamed protein product [Penicillium salamii]|uniref:RTA-like protein n=1 Tax=Penicillium salamii TaxID=1612424 RepID=A0A9W4I6I0_9EURO|nr:unnamed protein product [Penicillium salamii]
MGSSDYVLYQYTPSLVTAQRVYSHTKYFNPFIVRGIFQVIEYGAHTMSHFHPKSTTVYAIQNLLILLAPTLYAASIYMVLGRLIIFLRGKHLSYMPVKYLTKIFVLGDILSFILQGTRGDVMSNRSANLLAVGQWIIVAGLCVQLLFFSAFLVTSICFHCRITRSPTQEAQSSIVRSRIFSRDWRGLLFALYIASILILIRSIYRIVEFVQGNSGYLISHEVFLYVFDAAMMFLVMIVMNFFHPSVVLSDIGVPVSTELKRNSADSGEESLV